MTENLALKPEWEGSSTSSCYLLLVGEYLECWSNRKPSWLTGLSWIWDLLVWFAGQFSDCWELIREAKWEDYENHSLHKLSLETVDRFSSRIHIFLWEGPGFQAIGFFALGFP